jgi:hypothetical protein
MAGSGKGVLRIAIEDFLESFDPTNMLENLLVKFARFMFEYVLGRYISLLDEIAAVYPLSVLSEIASINVKDTNIIEKFLIVMGIIGSLITSFGNSYFQPFGDIARYAAQIKVLSGRIPVSHLVELIQKDPNLFDKFSHDAAEQGYTIDRILAMAQAELSELDLSLSIALYRRKIIDITELSNRLRALHINPDRVTQLIQATDIIPNVSDLIRMAVREAFSPEVVNKFNYDEGFPTAVLEHTQKQGLSDEWVKRYWYAHWELPSPQLGYEMLHRLRPNRTKTPFTEQDLDLLLRTADYAPYFRERMKAVSYTPLTRVDIRRIYKLGIIDANEVKERYMDIGYTEADAKILADFTVKYEDEQGGDKRVKYKDLSLSLIMDLYTKGALSENDFHTKVMAMGYDEEEYKLIIEYANLKHKNSSTIDYKEQFIKSMTKDISDAYSARMIDRADAEDALNRLGISPINIKYILDKSDYDASLDDLNIELKAIHQGYTSGAIKRDEMIAKLGELGLSGSQQNKVIERMELDLKYRNRRLTESEYRRAAIAGIISWDDYRQNLVGLGYTDADIDILVQLHKPQDV